MKILQTQYLEEEVTQDFFSAVQKVYLLRKDVILAPHTHNLAASTDVLWHFGNLDTIHAFLWFSRIHRIICSYSSTTVSVFWHSSDIPNEFEFSEFITVNLYNLYNCFIQKMFCFKLKAFLLGLDPSKITVFISLLGWKGIFIDQQTLLCIYAQFYYITA